MDNPTIVDDLSRLLGQAMRVVKRADSLAVLIGDARARRDTGTQQDCERTIEAAWPLACELLDLARDHEDETSSLAADYDTEAAV